MIGYVKCFDSNKTMSFNVIDKKLLIKKYSKIWEGVSNLMNTSKYFIQVFIIDNVRFCYQNK